MTSTSVSKSPEIRQLSGLDQVCFRCRLPICDESHSQCAWSRAVRLARSSHGARLAEDRAVREAARQTLEAALRSRMVAE